MKSKRKVPITKQVDAALKSLTAAKETPTLAGTGQAVDEAYDGSLNKHKAEDAAYVLGGIRELLREFRKCQSRVRADEIVECLALLRGLGFDNLCWQITGYVTTSAARRVETQIRFQRKRSELDKLTKARAALWTQHEAVILCTAAAYARRLTITGGTQYADAEDVQQEILLRAWSELPSFDPARGAMSTWVDRVARSRICNILERRSAKKRNPAHGAELVSFESAGREL